MLQGQSGLEIVPILMRFWRLSLSRWDEIEELSLLIKGKDIDQREQSPIEVMLWAVNDHLIRAFLRKVRDAISHQCGKSHEAVNKCVL